MTPLLCVVLAAAPSGTATVPLNELVELLQPGVTASKPSALVTAATLVGRPGEVGLWLEVAATVRVVGAGGVEVPLLDVGPGAVVEALSDHESASVELRDGLLLVRANDAGSFPMTARLLLRGTRAGRRAEVSFAAAARLPATPLKLDVDDGVFELPGAQVVREWGGYVRFAERSRYTVAWVSKQDATRAATSQRAPVEPLVREATSRWVTTLEGRATHEVKLALQVDRPGTMTIDTPAGQRLVRARVNGVPVAVPEDGERLTLEVGPVSLGAAEGSIELAYAQELGVFHLSGQLELVGPRVSWPVSKWTTQTVLPKVFRYLREGGSMEQLGSEEDAEGGLPGRSLRFSQHLLTSSAPRVSLGYSVDLTGSYFR
jgi:hypothetical protein